MNELMNTKLEQFAHNREAIKKTGFLMDTRMAAVCACMFAVNNQVIDTDKLMEMKNLLKSNVGIFSNFRGYTETAVICALAMAENPEELLMQSLNAYEALKEEFFFTTYLPMAAIMVAQRVPAYRYEDVAKRSHELYKRIKNDHPMLTGEEDELMCVIFALQDGSIEEQASNCEACFSQLKGNFGTFASGDGIQNLSEVLAAAGGNLCENCNRAIDLYHLFKEAGSAISNGFALGALGALAILPVDAKQLKEEVLEVSEALKNQKDYGFLGIDRGTRMIHAALLVASNYASDENSLMAAIQGTITEIIVEEIMILCMIQATLAVASHSS